jgi:hypothetical protein
MTKRNVREKLCLAGLLLLLAAGGCHVGPDPGLSQPADQVIHPGLAKPPRMRWGAYPTAILGAPFLGPNLGTHGYAYRFSENNGIVYTCRAGHVDIMHLRIAADWTAYLTARTYRHLMRNDPGFSYKLAVDRSRTYARLVYPPDWSRLSESQRSAIAQEVALAAGPYLTYMLTTWHEILTWFGYKCIGLPTEFQSAFSWEDSFSNLLGTRIGAEALRDTQRPFNEAVQICLDREMAKLGIQPARVARRTSESVKGTWYTGDISLLVTMRKRNFDIGLGDGLVTPTLIPSVPECPEVEPVIYPAPTLDVLTRHGFALTLEIEPREWEKNKILRVAYGDVPKKRINVAQHLPILMDYLRQAATAKYPEFDYLASEDGAPSPATADR